MRIGQRKAGQNAAYCFRLIDEEGRSFLGDLQKGYYATEWMNIIGGL